jgi:hypothetical protein
VAGVEGEGEGGGCLQAAGAGDVQASPACQACGWRGSVPQRALSAPSQQASSAVQQRCPCRPPCLSSTSMSRVASLWSVGNWSVSQPTCGSPGEQAAGAAGAAGAEPCTQSCRSRGRLAPTAARAASLVPVQHPRPDPRAGCVQRNGSRAATGQPPRKPAAPAHRCWRRCCPAGRPGTRRAARARSCGPPAWRGCTRC